ncbi:DUF305 domain-containing protein [Tsukamurella strandjordii]|uniref:DUF305 domain-containing protein n=1 Tax=Tsukamurella TaxID=2060 RepID=UPI001C7DE755|nr:DUF305 domain-containing protein [Tsukamurella sp. TY48]GIZ98015.1 DUF305 domain-containing protein [Tsukamurella sp. TY48]
MNSSTTGNRLAVLLVAMIVAALAGLTVGCSASSNDGPRTQAPGGPQQLSTSDIGFAQDMLMHHQQATQMIELLRPDLAADVRGIAQQIKDSQSRESGILMGWLEILGRPLQNPNPMAWMTTTPPNAAPTTHDMANMPAGHSMPGMATSEDLTTMANASGVQQEILFLQLMTRHHQGGIDMAAAVQRSSSSPTVRQRAMSMVKEQTDEVQAMAVQLGIRNAATLPYP